MLKFISLLPFTPFIIAGFLVASIIGTFQYGWRSWNRFARWMDK